MQHQQHKQTAAVCG